MGMLQVSCEASIVKRMFHRRMPRQFDRAVVRLTSLMSHRTLDHLYFRRQDCDRARIMAFALLPGPSLSENDKKNSHAKNDNANGCR